MYVLWEHMYIGIHVVCMCVLCACVYIVSVYVLCVSVFEYTCNVSKWYCRMYVYVLCVYVCVYVLCICDLPRENRPSSHLVMIVEIPVLKFLLGITSFCSC